jgi:hypothetical protein
MLTPYETYRKGFSIGKERLDDILGNIWELPSDWRLNFEFQHHILRNLDPNIDIYDRYKYSRETYATISRGRLA